MGILGVEDLAIVQDLVNDAVKNSHDPRINGELTYEVATKLAGEAEEQIKQHLSSNVRARVTVATKGGFHLRVKLVNM